MVGHELIVLPLSCQMGSFIQGRVWRNHGECGIVLSIAGVCADSFYVNLIQPRVIEGEAASIEKNVSNRLARRQTTAISASVPVSGFLSSFGSCLGFPQRWSVIGMDKATKSFLPQVSFGHGLYFNNRKQTKAVELSETLEAKKSTQNTWWNLTQWVG